MNIDLFTFITRGSADYAEFLKHTSEKFLSGNNKINWRFIESVNAERLPNGYDYVAKPDRVVKDKDFCSGSINHGIALNHALEYVNEKYVIFIDADMSILYTGWDEVVIKELDNYSFFGGGHGEGQGQAFKHRNFPAVFFFAFRSDVLDKAKLDFLPFKYKKKELIYSYSLDKDEANIFGRNEGEKLKCDTGWKIPRIAGEAKLTNKTMSMVLMTSKHRQIPFENIEQKKSCFKKYPLYMYEWHYNGRLFTTHQHGSRDCSLHKGLGKIWKNRIELYIKNCEL